MEFIGLLRTLSDAGVDFLVVGGVAGILHGSARLTQDLEVVYKRSEDNLERIVKALSPHHPYLRGAPPGLPFRWDVRTLKGGLNFTLTTDLGAVDLLGHVAGGPGYDELIASSVPLTIGDVNCRCVGLLRLIMLKKAAGRPKDLEAIAELEALTEEQA